MSRGSQPSHLVAGGGRTCVSHSAYKPFISPSSSALIPEATAVDSPRGTWKESDCLNKGVGKRVTVLIRGLERE